MIKELYEQWKKINNEHEEAYNRRLKYCYSHSKEYKQETHEQLIKKEIELANKMKKIESEIHIILEDRIYEVEDGMFVTFDKEYGDMEIVEECKDDQGTV